MNKLTAKKCRDFLQSIESVRATYGSICIKDAYFKEALEIALPLLEQQERGEDGWIEWGGGECPVSRNAQVDVKFSGAWGGIGRAGSIFWAHDGGDSDIIAYRIIPEQPTNQNGEQ